MLGRGLVAKVAQHVFAQAAGGIAVALHLAEQAITVLERPRALLIVECLVGSIAAVYQKRRMRKSLPFHSRWQLAGSPSRPARPAS